MPSNVVNKSAADRFIPNRSNCNVNMAHFKLINASNKSEKPNVNIFKQEPTPYVPYIKLLRNTIKYTDSPILNFSRKYNLNYIREELGDTLSSWPVNPRDLPILHKPDTVLDLPNVTTNIVANMLDWSSSGVMATISNDAVYLWSNKMEQKEEVASTNITAHKALKWSHDGRYLAVSCSGCIKIWDMIGEKNILTKVCYCTYVECNMTAIAWDKTDKSLVTGCNLGVIRTWNMSKGLKHLYTDKSVFAHYASIITIQFSTNNKYLCSSSIDSLVRLWSWPIFEPHFEIFCQGPVRGIAFHPWKDAILAVGAGIGDGSLSVWNVNNYSRIDYLKPSQESFVDCLAWNAVTGELVSSHQVANEKKRTMETKILVLSSLSRVVDGIDGHTGRVLYLLWNSTGTKLATAGSEENLCIWTFLGKKYSILQNPPCKRKTKKSQCTVMTFGKCIR